MLFSEWSIKRHKAHCGITQGLHNRLKRQKKKHVITLSTRAAQTKRVNMQPGTSAGKHDFQCKRKQQVTTEKRGKTWNRRERRAKQQKTSDWPMKSAGKHLTSGKGGETSYKCQAPEKHVTSDEHGEKRYKCLAPDKTWPVISAGGKTYN